MRRRWTGTLATAATAVLAAFTLASCSPPHRNLIGVRPAADGGAVAMLRPCGEDRAASARVLGSVTTDTPEDPVEDLTSWHVSAPRSAEGPENIALFHTPDGWTSDRPPQGDQRLKATHSYSAGFVVLSDGGGVDYQGVVHFTAADLARLEPGQVWAGGRTMTVEEFEKHTGQECDDGWF
ncbi:hypothetical protein OG875_02875 [Streptomyces sp. NBC_01498]|uniref:hypothetical protein n=1 Tax=Streptomyces sp. NBC_01498 TaxID=2975870 RepID=UPI002E7BB71D|nr:hypothetical protein [Streptomyces sp. NBC_01498]WTL23637.1 hypothetical protein OG875_02875 [Streptomyces sp. NBC_01498]